MCDKKVELKVGHKVTRNGAEGEVVAIMTKPDPKGHTHVILTNYGATWLSKADGTSDSGFPPWVKAKKIIKGTVFVNIYGDGSVCAHYSEQEARKASYDAAIAVAVPAHYEYEE